jgi:hypothetical protein
VTAHHREALLNVANNLSLDPGRGRVLACELLSFDTDKGSESM